MSLLHPLIVLLIAWTAHTAVADLRKPTRRDQLNGRIGICSVLASSCFLLIAVLAG